MTVEMPASGGVFPFTRLNVNADCLRVKTGKTQMFSHETILRLRFCFCGRFFFPFQEVVVFDKTFLHSFQFLLDELVPLDGQLGYVHFCALLHLDAGNSVSHH